MKAMDYILKDLSSRISYDEISNVYIETAGLSWFEDEFLMYMGISWHQGDEYIFISKEDCDKYNEYEIIMPDGLEYDGSVRRPWAETSSELIDKNDKINYYVWNTFLDHFVKGQKFYVLAIAKEIKGAKSLEDLMQKNLITEVMVTNYEIKSFNDDKYKNVLYTVYEFDKFIKAIMKYSNYGKNGEPYTIAEREKIFKDNNLIW